MALNFKIDLSLNTQYWFDVNCMDLMSAEASQKGLTSKAFLKLVDLRFDYCTEREKKQLGFEVSDMTIVRKAYRSATRRLGRGG